MLPRVRETFDGVAALREDDEEIPFRQVELSMFALTEHFAASTISSSTG